MAVDNKMKVKALDKGAHQVAEFDFWKVGEPVAVAVGFAQVEALKLENINSERYVNFIYKQWGQLRPLFLFTLFLLNKTFTEK